MAVFEMVKYHTLEYPSDIPLRIEECAAHFDITYVKAVLKRSLHTEYSYGKRKLSSSIIGSFPVLATSNKDGVPKLWSSLEWGRCFAEFIFSITDDIPSVIEIHPPFTDYATMDSFIDSFRAFEEVIRRSYPMVQILIENRCGSVYKGGKFLLSKLEDLERLCEQIEQHQLALKIAFDVPQIFTAHNAEKHNTYSALLRQARSIRGFVGGVHLWGKRRSASGRLVSHCGDLTSYFGNDIIKEMFLEEFAHCFDDEVSRLMVLEVNSRSSDLSSIIADLLSAGITFM